MKITWLRGGIVTVLIAAGLSFWWLYEPSLPQRPVPRRPRLIAHAGGAIDGRTYTNSLEALDANYARGHRYFELDFHWISDDHLVLIHDWEATLKGHFTHPAGQPSLAEFQSLAMKHGLHQMTLENLLAWLAAHPDAYVVTDVKQRNLEALRQISQAAGDRIRQFIPQIYERNEYARARRLGFPNLIFTLYRSKSSNWKILKFAARNPLFAVTMSLRRVSGEALAQRLNRSGVFVYVHTVNSTQQWQALCREGVCGLYTDHLTPEDMSRAQAASVAERLRHPPQARPIPALTENRHGSPPGTGQP